MFTGAAPEPVIRRPNESNDWALLQCEAHGVAPLTVEWKDSDNKTLNAEPPQVSKRDGQSYITIKINVTKTNNYRCVATQETLSHQVAAVTFVHLPGQWYFSLQGIYLSMCFKNDNGFRLNTNIISSKSVDAENVSN